MFVRKNFVTNSSSTCFIAFGMLAETKDKKKFENLRDTIEEYQGNDWYYSEDGVGIEVDRFGSPTAVLFIKDTHQNADEYDFWQSVEHGTVDREEATKKLQEIAKKYALEITEEPKWGFFNSGH